ncbi:unnamed protein product [Prunus armeniaca]|uniref:Uncharacterized protein n=1 Tax=Prunus armeniaca TaxID=36596 RepID=A0A6J5XK70_PRUAR|nr:unnamed protein product [Prunus armeniaca]
MEYLDAKARPPVPFVAPASADQIRTAQIWRPPMPNFVKLWRHPLTNATRLWWLRRLLASAIKFALNRNFIDIILEMNSKILVDGISGIGPLEPRELNRTAHEAVAIGIRAKQLESWAVRPPPSLVGVLLLDGIPCPPWGTT